MLAISQINVSDWRQHYLFVLLVFYVAVVQWTANKVEYIKRQRKRKCRRKTETKAKMILKTKKNTGGWAYMSVCLPSRQPHRRISPPPCFHYNEHNAASSCLRHWCGLRPSVLGQDRSQTKKNRSWSCSCRSGVVLWNTVLLAYARRHNDLEGHSNFSSLICAWNITTVEINSVVYLLKS